MDMEFLYIINHYNYKTLILYYNKLLFFSQCNKISFILTILGIILKNVGLFNSLPPIHIIVYTINMIWFCKYFQEKLIKIKIAMWSYWNFVSFFYWIQFYLENNCRIILKFKKDKIIWNFQFIGFYRIVFWDTIIWIGGNDVI